MAAAEEIMMAKEIAKSPILKMVLSGIIAKELELATGLMVNLQMILNPTSHLYRDIFVRISLRSTKILWTR